MVQEDRSRKAYPSDLTDEQWAIVAPLIPPAKQSPRGGSPRAVDMREVLNTIEFIPICGRNSRSSTWRTRSATSGGCGAACPSSRGKRCRMVKDRIRLWKAGVRDLVMELCCALHNFRVRLHPWQPMV